ncbi:beta-Ig-H3/fasciclin [Nitzschia inconspicua]|uniref:Beta-Ig-H3/fasciclin n=1 Tax=Nitzschia inconspicua TaxID=303405 RepID=A0A9K3KY70_9STRA|nr:beta-Ig-H3/fasciclin [Nitzschia inconspicua]
MRFVNTAASSFFVATIFLVSSLPVIGKQAEVVNRHYHLCSTNQAFANVLSNPNVDLSPAQIAQILRYHFVPSGEFLASDISDGLQLRSAFQSERLTFQVNSTGVFVNNFSQVVQPNMMASNGVIHKIGNPSLATHYS